MLFPIFCVGHEIPFRATYFRQDLSHVVDSPNLRVLCLIRLPSDHRQLPSYELRCFSCDMKLLLSTSAVLSPHVFVSLAFQFSSLISHKSPDGFLKFSSASLCTCHNLLTTEILHILTMSDAYVLTSVDVKPLVDHPLCSPLEVY